MLRLLFLVSFSSLIYAQKPVKLVFAEDKQEFHIINSETEILPFLFQLGLPEAEILDTLNTDSFLIFTISKGTPYQLLEIRPVNFDKSWLKPLSLNKEGNLILGFDQIFEIKKQALLIAAENGYPLAEVSFKNWFFSPELSKVELIMLKNNPIVIGSLTLKNLDQIQKKYFSSLLNLKENKPYNHQSFLNIEKKISTYRHIELKEKPQVFIEEGKANILLHPEIEHNNQIDFLLGILPNSNQNNKMILTGIAKGLFQNLTGWGDQISFNYEQVRPISRNLEAHFFLPYIPGLSFGTALDFLLEKRDSNFIQIQYRLGFIQPLDGESYWKVFWKREKSSILNSPEFYTQILENYIINELGMELRISRLNNFYNPKKGWSTDTEISFGQKSTKEPKTLRFFAMTRSSLFLPVFKNSTIMLGLNSGLLVNSNTTFTNEMFRIGGNQSLRGFDQELFFAENYSIFTGEYRLLIDKNAYLAYFIDFGVLNLDQKLWGTGGGLSIETSAGIFNFNLGFGKNQNLPFDFSSPKIHFGYVSVF